jgi:hypothetical protein
MHNPFAMEFPSSCHEIISAVSLSHPAAEAVEACPAITFCRNTAIAHLYQQMSKNPVDSCGNDEQFVCID